MTTIDASMWLDPDKAKRAVWPWVVAGGALRDSWVGAEPKDIDVFMWLYSVVFKSLNENGEVIVTSEGDVHNATSRAAGCLFKKKGGSYGIGGGFASFTSEEMPGINLILLPWPEGVEGEGDKKVEEELADLVPLLLDTFPCSLAQVAWWPGMDMWWTTDKFKTSMSEEVVFVEWCDNGEKYYNNKIKSHPVFGKWVAKYERW